MGSGPDEGIIVCVIEKGGERVVRLILFLTTLAALGMAAGSSFTW